MAPTPSSKPIPFHHHSKTPQSKHRLNFPKEATAAAAPSEHPVEVIGRIRDHPEQKNKLNPNLSALQINGDGKTLRVKTDIGYRDFTLDGVSVSEEDDLDGFYTKFVESRINGVKLGQKCTIMMYGPTGSGKSHTMFGCSKQPGIVYSSLKGILGEENGEELGLGMFVQVTVLEIYNEEIYDLLSSTNNGGGFNLGWSKGGSASKVRLEVMGKKAKNATFIWGNEAGKIMKEIQKVEKRRIVKSTHCNERSSRSHCMIILDVPTVGGRLMLVDMAGSENIEQAGQTGFEAKMQTAKINQGNIALKRVVESIANGDSHVPFRDSKLTMLLQDSFEDDESKILMILCASPDQKELHKTITTLEYGAKAKCIVRASHTPIKQEGIEDPSTGIILGSRIVALDRLICKLQTENKLKEKERDEAKKKLKQKEEEVTMLRKRLAAVEASEDIIDAKVKKREAILKSELERKVRECQRKASEVVEVERRTMEERMIQQQKEAEILRQCLAEIEAELLVHQSRTGSASGNFMTKLLETCSDDSDMVKSMDLDRSIDMEMRVVQKAEANSGYSYPNTKACLTTVYEDDEVQKEVIEEKKMIVTPVSEKSEDAPASRQLIIQNIFTLCGNNRELSQHSTEDLVKIKSECVDTIEEQEHGKSRSWENHELLDDDVVVYVEWEGSKENPRNFITTLKVRKSSTLAGLRKLIESHLGGDQQGFTFLVLQEEEAETETSKLPIFNNQVDCRLACLCPVKPIQRPTHQPFTSLENKIPVPVTPNSELTKKGGGCISPEMPKHLSSTPFITVRRR